LRLLETYVKVALDHFHNIIQFFTKEYKNFYASVYIMNASVNTFVPNVPPKYFNCSFCNYNTKKQCDYNKHLLTKKHLSIFMMNEQQCKPANVRSCVCGKTYKYRQSLYNHKQACEKLRNAQTNATATANAPISNELILKLIQQNAELLAKATAGVTNNIVNNYNTTNNNNTNSNNSNNNTNNFNLQFYLNETCKDALTMDEFLDTIHIKLIDLDNSRILGYSGGLSKIIIKHLNEIDEHKRPIHCSDLKRNTMYVKAGVKWEKENDEHTNIKRAIKIVEHKTIKHIPEWVKTYPNCLKASHRDSTPYLNMIMELTGRGMNLEKEESNINAIIKKIAEKVVINKSFKASDICVDTVEICPMDDFSDDNGSGNEDDGDDDDDDNVVA